jgi:hypothetical protein
MSDLSQKFETLQLHAGYVLLRTDTGGKTSLGLTRQQPGAGPDHQCSGCAHLRFYRELRQLHSAGSQEES